MWDTFLEITIPIHHFYGGTIYLSDMYRIGGVGLSTFLKSVVRHKLRQLSVEEIVHYGKAYGFSVTNEQAQDIVSFLSTHELDPFNEADRTFAFNQLAQITTRDTAQKAEKLFMEIIKSYHLEHLFE